MAIKTYTEQLEEVQAAISKIMQSGQSVTYNGRQMDKADLAVLDKIETRLRKRITPSYRRVRQITQL